MRPPITVHTADSIMKTLTGFSLADAGLVWVWWAVLFAVFVALNATGAQLSFRFAVVVSFISNVLIAALIVWVGDLIGVGSQLSTAVLVVLGIRIFTNAAVIRRLVLHA